MKKLLLLLLILLSPTIFAQTQQTWREEATDNIWQTNGNWWNFPDGSPIIYGRQQWNNNHFTSQTSTADVNTHRFEFQNGANLPHTFSGNKIRFFDYSGQNPLIINTSSATHIINNNIEGDGDSADPLEIGVYEGNLTFNGSLNNMGAWINVYGNVGRGVGISGAISGNGGLTVKNNVTVTLSSASNTYSGATSVEAGTLIVEKGGHSASITTGAIAFTFASTSQAAGTYNFLPGQLIGTGRTLTSNLVAGKTITFDYATGSVTICDNVGLASATSSASPICANATTTLTYTGLTGTGASVTWTANSNGTGATYGTGTPSSAVGPGTYYAYATGGCGSPVSLQVVVGSIALSTPTVGLTSSDLDNTFVSGSSVTFTATAGSLAGGTASYNFKVNGSSVQSGASNTYATSALANNDQVSVEISVAGGSCLSSATATSNTITNTVTTYYASVTSYCGLTMPKLASTIYCSIPSGVTGTLTYRFKVKKTGTMDAESIVNRTVNSFNLSLLPAIASYSTSYDVRVASVVDGLEQPTSAVCVVTTPSTVPAVSVNQCGATLAALNSILSVNAMTGATSFRYVVAASTAPTVFYTLTSSNSSFRLTDVPGLVVNYGSTYSVSAQQFVSNGAEFVWSPAGTCNVMTPASVPAVQINQCGQTLATMKTKITVNGVANAALYTFRVSTNADFSSPVQDFSTPYPSFSLNSLTTVPVTSGTEYFVKVKVTVSINSVLTDSGFGPACSFFTPELASKSIADAFSAVAYPNPFADSFMIDVTTSTKESINIKVYDMVGRMIEQRNATANDLEKSSIGDTYPSGVYNVILTQGSETKALRVIKR